MTTDTHVTPLTGPVAALSPIASMLAAQVDDLETARMAMANRYRILTTPGDQLDEDGIPRGFGLTDEAPDVQRLDALLNGSQKRQTVYTPTGDKLRADVQMPGLADIEAAAVKHLVTLVEASPWGDWLKTAPGVGAKTLARLLAAVGDPRWNERDEKVRTLGQLRSYCGMAVVDGIAVRRQRGGTAKWSQEGRKRLYVIAQGCIKQPAGTKYRDVYDASRAHYREALHTVDCVRCGPSGKPALAGTPLSLAHQHGRATRAIMKAVLTDVWLEARRQHGEVVTVEAPEPGLREPV